MEAEKSKEVEEVEEEWVVEPTTREDYINCACNAFNTVSESNPMTTQETAQVKSIKEKCLQIISYYVDEMHSEIFDEDE